MATVLDGIRGLNILHLTHMIAMPDDEYATYLAEVRGLKPKKQKLWKRRNVKTDGSTQTIRFDGEGFYTQWLNQHVAVKSVSMITELEREVQSHTGFELHGFGAQGINYRNPASYHASMDRMQDETHTGNHQPRNHRIHVRTKAGEPVRG